MMKIYTSCANGFVKFMLISCFMDFVVGRSRSQLGLFYIANLYYYYLTFPVGLPQDQVMHVIVLNTSGVTSEN